MRLLIMTGAVLILLVATSTATATAPVDVEGARLAVVEAVNTDTMNFGGIYLDAGNTLVIEYVGANAGRAAVDSILDPRISVRWQQVDRSRAELDEIAASIKDSHLDGVVMIGIDTIHNQVEVTVSPSDKVGDLLGLLSSEYGAGVNVVAGSPMFILPSYRSPSPSD